MIEERIRDEKYTPTNDTINHVKNSIIFSKFSTHFRQPLSIKIVVAFIYVALFRFLLRVIKLDTLFLLPASKFDHSCLFLFIFIPIDFRNFVVVIDFVVFLYEEKSKNK